MTPRKSVKRRPHPPTPQIILLNKPFRVLCQFTDPNGRPTLADYVQQSDFYAAGRLDYESEGLVVLTNDGRVQRWISDPQHKLSKTYWVQVEGIPDETALIQLRHGLVLKDGPTLPAEAEVIEPPPIWPRTPPIRVRQSVPDAWILLTLREGRNRQVRRMTAAVGFPTLRLIRWAVGPWTLAGLDPGSSRTLPAPRSPTALTRNF